MKIAGLVLSASIALGTASQVSAQTDPSTPIVRIQDGGAGGRMQSIFIPPKPGAPFSFVLATEWKRPLPDNGSLTLVNERHIARDSKGRIYQERWLLVPKGGSIKSRMDIFQITDPEQHTWLNCDTAAKVCDLYLYHLTTEEHYPAAIYPSGLLPGGKGFRDHEDLGLGTVDGLETHGYRQRTTINAGAMGNDKPMITTREFWYSPQLAVNLISTVDSPQTGKQIFKAKEISTAEPDPELFNVPSGYKIVDRREQQSN